MMHRPGLWFVYLMTEKSGYSALAVASDGTIICAYERGENNYRKNIALARFNLAWLMAKAVSASK